MIAQPKVITLSAPTIRNQRTLIWLQDQTTAVNWSRWDGIVTSLEAYDKWSIFRTNIVGMVLTECVDSMDKTLERLFQISKMVPMIFLSQSLLSHKSEEFWKENFDNLFNLDLLSEQYPFLETTWNGTSVDAVAMITILCRYHRLVDCRVPDSRINLFSSVSVEFKKQPQQLYLITQFFRPSAKKRFQEIKDCLTMNCACSSIDKIILINEKDYSNEWKNVQNSNKIHQVITGRRLTYGDFLGYVCENVPENVFTVLSNADIYFDESLTNLWKMNLKERMLALLRWDDDGRGANHASIFGPRADSQDTWIFLSDSIRQTAWNMSDFDFQLGQVGCDNAFAGSILRNRFLITNPAMTIKSYHLHNSNIRTYDKKDYIRAPLYINLVPTYLIDTRQELTPKKSPQCICNELSSFEIKSSSLSNEITYCTMLEKEGRYKWEAQVENFYFEPAIPVYSWNNAGVTSNGLVYDLYNIYTGKYAVDNPKYNYWKNATVDIFTPLQRCERMIAIPFMDTSVFTHPDVYILNYISRCSRLLSLYPNSSFWIPANFQEYVENLDWNDTDVKGIPFEEQSACWANEVIGFLPGPSSQELGREDIQSLRNLIPYWMANPVKKNCVVVMDDILNEKFVYDFIYPYLQKKSNEWNIRVTSSKEYGSYHAMLGASLCIFIGGKHTESKWAKLWALPKNCCVLEFQQELSVSGEFQHLSHVSDFKSWIMLLSKGTTVDVQDQIITQLDKWWKKNSDELYVELSDSD